MLDFWRKLLRRDPPLTRDAHVSRTKSWTADSGYVYEYRFAGLRRLRRSGESLIEYQFNVSGARAAVRTLSVFLPEDKLADWSGTRRELSASERYGIAKLCLKQEFDRAESPADLRLEVNPRQEQVAEIARTLDL